MKVAWMFAAVALLSVARIAYAPPSPEVLRMPGEDLGTVWTRWLAPNVTWTQLKMGNPMGTGPLFNSVKWLKPDGTVKREVSGTAVEAHDGYVLATANGQVHVYSTNGDWDITLPNLPGVEISTDGTADSRVFVRQWQRDRSQIGAEIYIWGKLAATIGPLPAYQGYEGNLAADGSLALLTARSADNGDAARLLVFGPDGREAFRADCDGPVAAPNASPNGAAVLLVSDDIKNIFSLYTPAGKTVSLDLGRAAFAAAWVPGTMKAVMENWAGESYRIQLLDWQSGKQIWDQPDPLPGGAAWMYPAIAVTKDYVLVGGLENPPRRSVYALDIKTGKTIAHWAPEFDFDQVGEAGRFLQLGDRVFMMADHEFSEINLNDIAARAGGWK
jgi:hypothetical protein